MANEALWVESGVDNLVFSGYRYRDYLSAVALIDPTVTGCMADLYNRLSTPYCLVFLNPYNFQVERVTNPNEEAPSDFYTNGVQALRLIRESVRNSGAPVFLFSNGLERTRNKDLLHALEREVPLVKTISLSELPPADLSRLVKEVLAVRALSGLLL